jgi:RimJ/RimL family protein N-acetyltransferase
MEIRVLRAPEWEAFRDVRLLALKSEPGVFGSTYERESAFTKDDWHDRVSGIGKEMFGLYDGDRIIGITGFITDASLDEGRTAILVASYLLPEYRGRGLSALFYKARIAWARERGNIDRITVGVRTSNEPSRRALLRHGFIETARFPRTWHDGATEEQIDYELSLRV